ncbi:3'-5' exonuclease, partial [Micromonospora sp. NPDC000668]|uniref:3'-5' exonuclease n=1 Tax=Micromonospora sp. NPDC000668 TaxID=3364219 RepID=UPI0036BAC09D
MTTRRRVLGWLGAVGGLVVLPTAGFAGHLYLGSVRSNVGTLTFRNRLRIPPLLRPSVTAAGVRRFRLTLAEGRTELLPRTTTRTWGANGTILGPTLRARRGDRVLVEVQNQLPETTSLHWHVYDSRVSLGALGISVIGRSSRLRVNYRSTEEILAWSTGVLVGSRIEDLGGDGDESLAGYRSLLHGKRPHAAGYPTSQAEVAALVERVGEWLKQGVAASEIAVCARFNLTLNAVRDALADAGIPSALVRDQPGADVDGVRLATMHAMKGLEFRCVAVVGVTARAVPFAKEVTPTEVDPMQHESDLLRERCLLFVASTRAREALHVSWSGQPSPFLAYAVAGGAPPPPPGPGAPGTPPPAHPILVGICVKPGATAGQRGESPR